MRILTAAIVTVVLVLFVVIVPNSFIKDAPPVKNVIVLGMALENGRPNSDLIKRVEAAAGYAKENPEAVLIVTGGNKGESGETEADVMRRLLTEQGISGERIINEDEAVNTVENFANVAKKTGTDEPVLIVTSGYHMLRACGIAGNTGFSDIKRFPASSGVLFWPANVTWEIICEINSIIH